jgi:hypothetical protein
VLGVLTFAIIIIGLRRAGAGLEGIGALPEVAEGSAHVWRLGWVILGAALCYAGYIVVRHLVLSGSWQILDEGTVGRYGRPVLIWMPRVYTTTIVVVFVGAVGWPLEFTARIGRAALGFDHGVGHSLLLLYNAKTSHCENINYFNDLGHDPSSASISLL